MLLQKVLIQSRIVVVIVAARVGTGIEPEILVTRAILSNVFVAVNAIIQRHRDAHRVRSVFLMFGVACQAIRRVDLFQQNGFSGIDEFRFRMRVTRFLQIGTVTIDARLIGHTTVRKVARLAAHFDLVVAMSGFARQVDRRCYRCCLLYTSPSPRD